MSTLRLTTISNQTGSSSVPSETVINGSAKAWVNFNGTGTVAIRASFNVSSITDNGTGDYTLNFTTAFADANYSIMGSSGSGNSFGSYGFNNPGAGTRFAAGSCRINSFITQTAGVSDVDTVCVGVFR